MTYSYESVVEIWKYGIKKGKRLNNQTEYFNYFCDVNGLVKNRHKYIREYYNKYKKEAENDR